MKYRKKPITIEAWFMASDSEKPQWLLDAIENGTVRVSNWRDRMYIDTLEGTMTGFYGMDYIVRGVDGELYPCKKHIFEKTYEQVEE